MFQKLMDAGLLQNGMLFIFVATTLLPYFLDQQFPIFFLLLPLEYIFYL